MISYVFSLAIVLVLSFLLLCNVLCDAACLYGEIEYVYTPVQS